MCLCRLLFLISCVAVSFGLLLGGTLELVSSIARRFYEIDTKVIVTKALFISLEKHTK